MTFDLHQVRALIDLMVEKRVLIAKVDGVELTLHPHAFAPSELLPDLPKPKPKEELAVDDREENPLRSRLRELASQERINGMEIDEATEFAHTEGGRDPFDVS